MEKYKNLSSYFVFLESCSLVKGAKRSLIIDFQRATSFLIQNSLFEFIVEFSKNKKINEIYQAYDKSAWETIDSYFEFLTQKELIIFASKNELKLFEKINPIFDFPGEISNCILDIKDIRDDILTLFRDLSKLGCKYIAVRFYSDVDTEFVVKICEESYKQSFKSIYLYFSGPNTSINYGALLQKHIHVGQIIIFNAKNTTINATDNGLSKLTLSEVQMTNEKICGYINIHNFNFNLETYTESIHHNSCLNRKISIDTEGNIKNCPSMSQSFGNIRDTTLQQALEHPDFKKYWNVTKDQIEVCKDCEFRYICTDCRAYIENPEDMYSKPLKCGYNPYTCEWEEWSTNPLKQKAIDYYGMREVLPEFQLKPDFVPSAQPKK